MTSSVAARRKTTKTGTPKRRTAVHQETVTARRTQAGGDHVDTPPANPLGLDSNTLAKGVTVLGSDGVDGTHVRISGQKTAAGSNASQLEISATSDDTVRDGAFYDVPGAIRLGIALVTATRELLPRLHPLPPARDDLDVGWRPDAEPRCCHPDECNASWASKPVLGIRHESTGKLVHLQDADVHVRWTRIDEPDHYRSRAIDEHISLKLTSRIWEGLQNNAMLTPGEVLDLVAALLGQLGLVNLAWVSNPDVAS